MNLYTGIPMYSLEDASLIANCRTKRTKYYHTAIKGIGVLPYAPEKCWAVTNRHDPRVGVKK